MVRQHERRCFLPGARLSPAANLDFAAAQRRNLCHGIRHIGRRRVFRRGTNGSNPSPSSAESGANRTSLIMVGCRRAERREKENAMR
jgi:hypothetical protein